MWLHFLDAISFPFRAYELFWSQNASLFAAEGLHYAQRCSPSDSCKMLTSVKILLSHFLPISEGNTTVWIFENVAKLAHHRRGMTVVTLKQSLG